MVITVDEMRSNVPRKANMNFPVLRWISHAVHMTSKKIRTPLRIRADVVRSISRECGIASTVE